MKINNCKTIFSVLPASWRDTVILRQLAQDCFGDDAHPLLEILAMLSLPGFIRLKAMVDDKIVGFILAEIYSEEDVAWITALGVSPDYRRMGIGKALMSACEERLGKSCIRLCVRESNLPAIQLYEQTGYHQKTVWQNYYNPENAIVMEKER